MEEYSRSENIITSASESLKETVGEVENTIVQAARKMSFTIHTPEDDVNGHGRAIDFEDINSFSGFNNSFRSASEEELSMIHQQGLKLSNQEQLNSNAPTANFTPNTTNIPTSSSHRRIVVSPLKLSSISDTNTSEAGQYNFITCSSPSPKSSNSSSSNYSITPTGSSNSSSSVSSNTSFTNSTTSPKPNAKGFPKPFLKAGSAPSFFPVKRTDSSAPNDTLQSPTMLTSKNININNLSFASSNSFVSAFNSSSTSTSPLSTSTYLHVIRPTSPTPNTVLRLRSDSASSVTLTTPLSTSPNNLSHSHSANFSSNSSTPRGFSPTNSSPLGSPRMSPRLNVPLSDPFFPKRRTPFLKANSCPQLFPDGKLPVINETNEQAIQFINEKSIKQHKKAKM